MEDKETNKIMIMIGDWLDGDVSPWIHQDGLVQLKEATDSITSLPPTSLSHTLSDSIT